MSERTAPERAQALGISREAVELYDACQPIDLHIESFLWTRMGGYDLWKRHGTGLLDARFYSQVDLPRALESGMAAGVWSIATNAFRPGARTPVLLRNIARLRAQLERHPDKVALVKDHAGYLRARAEGKYVCWMAIQGGNALDSAQDLERLPDDLITRITLVHLTNSPLGGTNSPLGSDKGLTSRGRELVSAMNARRILVDLAHIGRKGFFDALEVHDRAQPAIVSHTGLSAVTPMWRNIDDAQVKAIAQTGGVVAVIYHSGFLGESYWGGTAARLVDHLEHVVKVAGDEFAALGSDWDGLICTPRDMKTILELPVLVQRMLDRGWSDTRIRRIMGGNYLRVMRHVRPGDQREDAASAPLAAER